MGFRGVTMKRFLYASLMSVICASLMMGSPFAEKQQPYTVGFVTGLITNPFYISMRYGAKAAADQCGIQLIWQGSKNWNAAEQTVVVDTLVAKGIDALIVAPCDPEALKDPLRTAAKAGVIVITVDTDIHDPDAKIRRTNIASNNYLGGFKAGQALAEAIGRKGEVALMGDTPGVNTFDERNRGFKDAIAHFTNIKLVATRNSEISSDKAMRQMGSVLRNSPQLAGAFAVDAVTSHGCASGILNAGRASTFTLVGFDAQPKQVEDLKQGLTSMLVAQDPFAMGYLSVQLAYDFLKGYITKAPGNFTTGFYVVTIENLNNPETQRWIYKKEPPQ